MSIPPVLYNTDKMEGSGDDDEPRNDDDDEWA